MPERMRVYATHRFQASHRWPAARGRYGLLRHEHRHLFHVRVEMDVGHGDREVEFLALRDKLERLCNRLRAKPTSRHWSCEHYATAIGRALGAARVEVSEDGENGATWDRQA